MNKLHTFDEAVRFHGHECPGLAIGYRVAATAIELLAVERPQDEELVAVVENDTCAVDAVQVVTGCTFGKGNLVFKDYGKGGFSFFSRNKNKAFRITYRGFPTLPGADGARMEELKKRIRVENSATDNERKEFGTLRQKLIKHILTVPPEELLKWQELTEEPPAPARIHQSIVCENCGEQVMDTRIRRLKGRSLCIPCAEAAAKKART
ncbi:MAG: formylmethanofuran dehydrogenase [Candidatus Abyssobacteria bacterium SURF_5]|uniref:Formylmethanofuran dehydrogenase n=1 Tax=Abyssobacteria bacterium (strain SURF_5) TaxID=2093360 RepID=A0A3A4P0Z2_ABYX5|nr:MAG: formylmethanofuran dehydrogenase [Candidatus Abyssubacteria bacterium SURF_5]